MIWEIIPEVVVFPFVPVMFIFLSMYLQHIRKKSGQIRKTIIPMTEVPDDKPVNFKILYTVFAKKSEK